MRNAKGFTLIELLIVIAIVAILAAVLIPNLIGARRRAFDAAALQCARAIALTAESTRTSSASLNYTFTRGDVEATDPRSCQGITTSNTYPANAATFTIRVSHPEGSREYVVSGDANGVQVTEAPRQQGQQGQQE